jgi:hypothetical protein
VLGWYVEMKSRAVGIAYVDPSWGSCRSEAYSLRSNVPIRPLFSPHKWPLFGILASFLPSAKGKKIEVGSNFFIFLYAS